MTGRSTGWVRPQPIRDAILAYLTEPRSARDIALHIDRPVPTATGHLAAMRRRGLTKRIAYAVYAPPDWPAAAETMGQLARSQPTRTAILEYLTEPRSAREIALHIDRSGETTGSHLTDMRRRGLIKRVGYGVYALPDSPTPEYPSGALVRPGTRRAAILAYLTEPRTVREITLHVDCSGRMKEQLAAMNRRGLVKRVGYGVYAPLDWPAAAETSALARSRLIRDAILEYLAEPRAVREIALQIKRAPWTTGRHLTDMRRRGLIKRVGAGVYALPDSPTPEEPSRARVRPGTIRAAILEYLTEPRSALEIALHINRPRRATAIHLTVLCGRGVIKCVGDAVYALPDSPVTAERSEAFVRQQPIHEAILAHLTEPRRRASIALHTECSVSTLKRHLAALCRRGLVKRIGRGVYALTDSSAEAELTTPAHAVTPPALCQHIAALPAPYRSVEDLSLETGLSEAAVKAALNDSWLHDYSVSAPVEPTRRLVLADRILSPAVRSASG
ncbi:MAG TPA: hypothetical protein VJY39_02255 [Acidisphaera sp.]|nr:hypothetical protein [Acidisphaera sp.]